MSCTLPPSGTHYVSTPNLRGTVDILSTSLSLIVLSTWSVLHLSVPIQTRPRTKREWLTRWIFRTSVKLAWMLIAIAVPELLVGRGIMQLIRAKQSKQELQPFVSKDHVNWSLGHSFFADMKGFEIVFSEGLTNPGYDLGSDNAIWARTTAGTSRVASMMGACIAKFTLELRPMNSTHPHSCHRQVEIAQRVQNHRVAGGSSSLSRIDSFDTVTTYVSRSDGNVQNAVGEPSKYDADEGALGIEGCNCQASTHETAPSKPGYTALTHLGVTRLAVTNASQQVDGKVLGPILWRPDAINFEIVTEAERLASTISWSPKALTVLDANLYAFQGTSWRLNAAQLAEVRSLGIIDTLPSISDEDLQDKGSSNSFLKIVVLLQIVWQLIDMITRKAQNLPTVPLEVLALALAMCALLTSICLWSKPQDVSTTFKINASRRPTAEDTISIALKGDAPGDSFLKYGPRQIELYDSGFGGGSPMEDWSLVLGILIGSIVFGGLHFLSWNHTFPTKIEQTLWHISAIASLVVPWLAALIYMLTHTHILPYIRSMTPGTLKRMISVHVSATCGIALEVFYILIRLYVAVECIRSLFFLEPKAFQSTWTVDLPHFR